MPLTASDMGIKEGLIPFFCLECGERLGWFDEADGNDPSGFVLCEDCSKKG